MWGLRHKTINVNTLLVAHRDAQAFPSPRRLLGLTSTNAPRYVQIRKRAEALRGSWTWGCRTKMQLASSRDCVSFQLQKSLPFVAHRITTAETKRALQVCKFRCRRVHKICKSLHTSRKAAQDNHLSTFPWWKARVPFFCCSSWRSSTARICKHSSSLIIQVLFAAFSMGGEALSGYDFNGATLKKHKHVGQFRITFQIESSSLLHIVTLRYVEVASDFSPCFVGHRNLQVRKRDVHLDLQVAMVPYGPYQQYPEEPSRVWKSIEGITANFY